MKVAVIGLGRIGLPLAARIAGSGATVHGADVAPAVVDAVNAAREPFPGEPGLGEALATTVASGALRATTTTAEAVAGAAVVVVVVPLHVDGTGRAHFAAIDKATDAVAAALEPGTLVVYETTVPVGTTRDRFGPALERGSGLAVGRDLDLAFSPERVSSGRVFADLSTYPKLVGGVDPRSTARAVAFYAAVLRRPDGTEVEVREMRGAEAAEFAKLAETTYRDVNIALANQFAAHAEAVGVDYPEIAAACNSQPFSHLHAAGIAVGGHCIPVYPYLYLASDPGATVVRAARTLNEHQPERAVDRLAAHYGDLSGARVAVLGISYRGGVKESSFSGAFAVIAALRARGAEVVVHDPLHGDDELRSLGLEAFRLGDPVDAAVVHTDHRHYATLAPADLPGVRVVLDGRDVVGRAAWEDKVLVTLGRADPTSRGGP